MTTPRSQSRNARLHATVALKGSKAMRGLEREAVGTALRGTSLVFCSVVTGGSLNPDSWRKGVEMPGLSP